MEDQTVSVLLFGEPGPQNTASALDAARRRAEALGLRVVVVASDTGETASRALATFGEGFEVLAVTNPAGMRLPVSKLHDYLPRFHEHRQGLVDRGVAHVQASMTDAAMDEIRDAGGRASRIDWRELAAFMKGGVSGVDRIGVAVRVALTVAAWAVVDGAVPPGAEVLAIAGTGFGGGGADTAIVVRTAKAWRDFRVLETICRPRVSPPSETA